MDLRPIATLPTDEERAAIDAILGAPDPKPTVSFREASERRHMLLPALHAAQDRRGFVSHGALGYICERLHVPPAEGFGVASFYALFALTERPRTIAHVCDDIACKARGADALARELEDRIGPALGSPPFTNPTAPTGWMKSPCLGLCERAPAALLVASGESPFERGFAPVTASSIIDALAVQTAPEQSKTRLPQREVANAPELRLLRRVGVVDPTSLDDYRAHDGFAALRRALEMAPSDVVREVTDAGLLGRGGAAFPTGRKWESVARMARGPKWVVCNADESEPGTFKDRILMEDDPYALIEALVIAGYAVGAEHGMIYVRDEYPLARARLEHAVVQCRARGFVGPDIMGRGISFDIEIRRGAGAYICGEETALLESIEGRRGEPRTKPPFPAEHGLFGKPTVINNVETLVNVLPILTEGSAAYRTIGTADSPGTRLFCLSGSIERPGLYEVPFGMRLDALIELAGGVRAGTKLRAVLLGGAAAAFLTPDELSMPLTIEDARKASVSLGSGVVLVLDDTIPLLPMLTRIASFFRDESCGQCVPCRVGTVRQEELVSRLVRKKSSVESERALLSDLGQVMRDASICGLGQTASLAVESAFKKLGRELEEESR